MPQIHISPSSNSEPQKALHGWFRAQGFTTAAFENGLRRVSTYRMDELITFKLRERPGYTTFYKETTGGALIVLEVAVGNDQLYYDGYCPLLLFGIWEKKLRFKQDSGALFKYRMEGHTIEQKFVDFVNAL